MKRISILLCLLAVVIVAAVFSAQLRSVVEPVFHKHQLAERLQQISGTVRARLRPHFDKAQLAYPPKRVTLVGLKKERVLQVYAADAAGIYHFICAFPILAASGISGPKLREGDAQVPEGIYEIESLNPNSAFHVALRVGYPNLFDREQAKKDGRTNLGGDIMIHGGAASIGCLAMGDEAAEDLFVLAADTGLPNISVVLAPLDFRTSESLPKAVQLPIWTESLYEPIRQRLKELPSEK